MVLYKSFLNLFVNKNITFFQTRIFSNRNVRHRKKLTRSVIYECHNIICSSYIFGISPDSSETTWRHRSNRSLPASGWSNRDRRPIRSGQPRPRSRRNTRISLVLHTAGLSSTIYELTFDTLEACTCDDNATDVLNRRSNLSLQIGHQLLWTYTFIRTICSPQFYKISTCVLSKSERTRPPRNKLRHFTVTAYDALLYYKLTLWTPVFLFLFTSLITQPTS